MFKKYLKNWSAILSKAWRKFVQRGEQMATTSMESRYESRVLRNSRSMSLPNSEVWSIVLEKMELR